MPKKYINADALIAEREEEIVDYDEDLQKHFIVKAVPTEYIEDFPAADVEEVRHGKWIKVRTNVYRCSHCLRIELLEGCNVTDENEKELLQIFYPYCHCGAKMDGEEKSE